MIAIEQALGGDEMRKSLLAESDELLEEVEILRLNDEPAAPPRLREAIRALQIRLGRRNPPVPPATIEAAHELVFAVQQRIMAANPNHPRPHRHAGRPGGQPVMRIVREDRTWKVLTLPPPPAAGGVEDAEWLALIDSTVERAWDRWCYAHRQAVWAAQQGFKAQLALAVVRAAWDNYWTLLEEAERIKARVFARRWGHRPGHRRPSAAADPAARGR